MPQDEDFMREALRLAQCSAERNEVPVGAVVVLDGEIIGRGNNGPIERCDPSAHAEIVALRAAAAHMANYRLPNTTLYVTIEPCAMCLGAIVHARVARLVFGAREPKAGVARSNVQLLESGIFNHTFEIDEGLLGKESAALMSGFFQRRREIKKLSERADDDSGARSSVLPDNV